MDRFEGIITEANQAFDKGMITVKIEGGTLTTAAIIAISEDFLSVEEDNSPGVRWTVDGTESWST